MPRTNRAAAKSNSTIKKRTGRKTISREPGNDRIQSSDTSDSISNAEAFEIQRKHSSDASSETDHSIASKSSNHRCSPTVSSVAREVDHDATPTQPMSITPFMSFTDQEPPCVPGFEAVEAVNSLYQKLKDSQLQIDSLQREKDVMLAEARKEKKRAESLQVELKAEKNESRKLRQAQAKGTNISQADMQKRLERVLNSLRSFRAMAHGIMPLLDVITDAADIEYNHAAEILYQELRQQDERQNEGADLKDKAGPSTCT